MFLNGFTASINTPGGDQLPEYQTKTINENTIECWIPSTEGENFEICSKAPSDEHPGLSVRCKPQLDGVSFQNLVKLAAYIGNPFKCRGQTTSTSSIRLFSFGKRLLTDREDIAPSKGSSQKDLNTIRVTFEWGKAGTLQPQTNFWVPKENGPIHEKVAKKGHSGSTGLGSASTLHRPPTVVNFEPVHDIQPLVFVFRYAPEDWLQAQGIMPANSLSTQKRDRDATPDIIDIDDLVTDDEDVTLVKHLSIPHIHRKIILNNFKATINTPEGDQLPEYHTKRIDENTIECWIPSTEGKNFEIGSKAPSNEHPGLSVRCKPQLDGVSFQNLVRLSANIGEPFRCRGQTTSTSSIRLFSFGKRLLTDKEDIAPSKGSSQKDLNTIRVTFEWGEAGMVQPQTNFWVPKENGPIHEKVAKKGHSGSAGLGSASSLQYSPTVVSHLVLGPLNVFNFVS
ncbi:hypothetical protein FRC12_001163 [Ceratobasidium sp. 428]|nr:hypothetical protein FRC12_001163 [Ceratobasidium sp. 428]